MTRSGPRDRHLDFATTLDYLDQRLDTSRGREVEEHLGRPCPVCREKLRTLGGLLETMRRDRTGEVPAHLHRIALDVFTPREQVSPVRRALETLAELVFDSLTSPLPAAVRRSVGEARRLRFKLGGHVLELEIEREGAATVSLRGVLAVGGGTRVRHTMSIALDLGLPVGGVAQLIGAMEELNAILLNALLAKHGSMPMQRDHFWDLPLYFAAGILPIAISIPPYHFWEPPPEGGPLPTHGSDFGLFMVAEVLGMRRIIFVKDEDGMYDCDPKQHADARRIERATLADILATPPRQHMLDELLWPCWRDSRHVEQIQIVNGLRPGQLTAALAGEPVGTIITKEVARG